MLSTEQQQIRAQGIGASEVAAVCGLDPFRAPIDIYLQKTGQAVPFEGNEQTRWGDRIEGLVAKWYVEEFPEWTLLKGSTERHESHPWAVATPDFFARCPDDSDNEKLVEVKNVGMRMAYHWANGAPDYVVAQVLWQMLVTGIQTAEVVAVIGGQAPQVFPVPWDEEQAGLMFEIAKSFWHNHVVARVPPEVDGSNSYREFLARLFPRSGPGLAKGGVEEVNWAAAYSKASKDEEDAKARKQEAANRLKHAIGEYEGLMLPCGKVTWKSDKTGKRSLRVSMKGQALDL
jgi:putative phage-type endonuclease